MTPRSLFLIVLKIIGILFIKDILDIMPQFVYNISTLTQLNPSDSIWSIIFSFFTIVVYIYVANYFIFKTDVLIDKLKLDKNFGQNNFPLNIHRSTILNIVIIIIGGLLIADNIPLLCRSVYLYFQNKSINNAYSKPIDYSFIVIYSVKIIVGLILIGNHQLFVNYIERKRKRPAILNETNEE